MSFTGSSTGKIAGCMLVAGVLFAALPAALAASPFQPYSGEPETSPLPGATAWRLQLGAYSKPANRPFVDVLWNREFKKFYDAAHPEEAASGVGKVAIALITPDLNGDGKADIIGTLVDTAYCGKMGMDCPLSVYVSEKNGGFRKVEFTQSAFMDKPIEIGPQPDHGLKPILLNGRFLHRYDGQRYVMQ